mmetsp:Transcript_14037/g.31979  ORF Transcript_14037/g.31979 Transcript_14037/m.31979 type:complete len:234 (+) Transcript_14037:662-1363(+)
MLHALLPLHRLEHLPLEHVLDLFHALVRLAGHIRVHLDLRHRDFGQSERLGERLRGLAHVRRVESSRDGKHLSLLRAHRQDHLAELREHLLVAGTRATLREHVIGDVRLLARTDLFRGLVERLLQYRVRDAGDGRHPTRRRLGRGVHGLGPRLHELEAIFKRERAGKDERGVLSERETGGGLDLLEHLRRLLLGLLHGSKREREDGRLRVERGVQLLLRPLCDETDHIIAHHL